MKKITILASVALMMAACGGNEKEYDATGTFEATETTVFAEQSGALLTFSVNEGDSIEANKEVGLIDTTQVWLKIQQLGATKEVYQSQKPDMERQIAATRQQLAKARQDEQRYRELVADGAAPSKMLDDAASQVKVLQRQLDAQISSLAISTRALDKQTAAADIQVSQMQDMLRKCHITAPAKGHLGATAACQVRAACKGVCRLWRRAAQGVRWHCLVDFLALGVYTQDHPHRRRACRPGVCREGSHQERRIREDWNVRRSKIN